MKSVYLALELEEEAQRNNLTAAVNPSCKCKMFAFVAMTYMLSDVIPIMEKLNLTFQREAVNLSDIQPVVDSMKASLQSLLTTLGHNKQDFSTTVTRDGGVFQTVKLMYCDNLHFSKLGQRLLNS